MDKVQLNECWMESCCFPPPHVLFRMLASPYWWKPICINLYDCILIRLYSLVCNCLWCFSLCLFYTPFQNRAVGFLLLCWQIQALMLPSRVKWVRIHLLSVKYYWTWLANTNNSRLNKCNVLRANELKLLERNILMITTCWIL